jgi:glycine/D-amino acid oxidase-like deaminating enzyme
VVDPLAGRLNGFALLQAMRPVLAAHGVALYEHTPVLRVREGPTITLTVPGGEVRAQAVVLATNAYTPALGYFRRGILPLHSHVVATAPLPAERWETIGWDEWDGFTDDLDRIAYACRTPAGRVVFGGGGNAAYSYRFGGATEALLAGRVLADLSEGNHEAWRDLPFYQRRLPPLPPEPLRWIGYQAYTRLTGRSPRTVG